jgi:hypothetical protein
LALEELSKFFQISGLPSVVTLPETTATSQAKACVHATRIIPEKHTTMPHILFHESCG